MKNKYIRIKRFITLVLLAVCTLSVGAQGIDGSWKGVLHVGQAKLNLVFNITKDSTGKPACTMDSPDQGAKGIPAEIKISDGTKMEITVGAIGMTYSGELKDGVIKGNFSQGGMSMPLDLTPGSVELKRPQTPKPPFPYTTEEVTFTNATDNAVLSGTLTIPAAVGKARKGKTPVIIMVSGSGLQNRDEEIFGHKPFLVLADYLARHGIASLRYDDRGVDKSKGDVVYATTENFKNDAAAALAFIRADKRFGSAGVLGHSEGGTIAFMLGAEGKADYIVSLAGTALRGDSILLDQNMRGLAMSGFPQKTCENYCRALEAVFARIVAGETPERADIAVQEALRETGVTIPESLSQNLVQVIKTTTPWLRYTLAYSPQPSISRIKCPVMALNGSKDTQVSAVLNLNAVRRLLPENKRNVINEYAGLNHLFQHCTFGGVDEYGTIEETMSEEVMKDIAEWVKLN